MNNLKNIENLKMLLPLVPCEYRRPLILFMYIREIMDIIDSCHKCLNEPADNFLCMQNPTSLLDSSLDCDLDEINKLFNSYLNS